MVLNLNIARFILLIPTNFPGQNVDFLGQNVDFPGHEPYIYKVKRRISGSLVAIPWLPVLCNIAPPEMPAERNCLEFSKAKSAQNLSILQDHLCLADSGLGNYLYNWFLL